MILGAADDSPIKSVMMKPIASRIQWRFLGAAYAAFFAVAAVSLYQRHLVELQDPVAASGGMAAFGDTILYFFLGCLFLIPTAFLIWIIAKSETLYTKYSQFLFALSLSAPVCLCGVLFGGSYSFAGSSIAESLSGLCFFRVLGSPMVLMGMGISRFAARYEGAKRLTARALLVEGLTIGVGFAAFVWAVVVQR